KAESHQEFGPRSLTARAPTSRPRSRAPHRLARSSCMFLGDQLLAYLVLAMGGALLVGNVMALVKPPPAAKEGELARAPVARSLGMAGLGPHGAGGGVRGLGSGRTVRSPRKGAPRPRRRRRTRARASAPPWGRAAEPGHGPARSRLRSPRRRAGRAEHRCAEA